MLLSGSGMCGLSSAASDTETEKQLQMDGCSPQTRGQQPVRERKQREAESTTQRERERQRRAFTWLDYLKK